MLKTLQRPVSVPRPGGKQAAPARPNAAGTPVVIRATAAGLTDVGRQRAHNEDHLLIKPGVDLFVVADGMGGHNAGDVASALTTTSLDNFFEATRTEPIPANLASENGPLAPAAERLAAAVRKANRDVFEISSTFKKHHGMGSTVVAAHVARYACTIHIAHVGDSRCYRIRDGAIELLTRDHSLINDALAIKPDLNPDEVARLPRNIITRALGMKDVVSVDLRSEPALPGDLYLLCSDGLSGLVTDEQILEVTSITDGLAEACELLVAMANDAGGNDNITALIVRIDKDPDAKPAAPEPVRASAPDIEADSVTLDQATVDRGLPLEALASAVDLARCTKCDHELYVGDLFCVECGTPAPK